MDFPNIVDFYGHVQKLKGLPRSGWVARDIENPETVASHSFGVAVLSMVMGGISGESLNMEKVLKMALFHDIAEAVTGDLTPDDKEYKDKEPLEEDALKGMVADLPSAMRTEILGLVRDLNEGKTPEAKTVESADKLDMALTAIGYQKSGKHLKEFLDIPPSHFSGAARDFFEYIKRLGNSE